MTKEDAPSPPPDDPQGGGVAAFSGREPSARVSPAFPVASASWEEDVAGEKTSLHVSHYANRTLVAATQLGTLGTLLSGEAGEAPGGGSVFAVRTLMGRREDPLLEVLARQITERLCDPGRGPSVPLLIALGLKPRAEGRTVREVIEPIVEALARGERRAREGRERGPNTLRQAS